MGLAPARGAFLLILRTNLFKLASNLKYGYVTDEQAQRMNLPREAVDKARGMIKKLKQIWYDVGGDPAVLERTIIKGGGGLSGFEMMGALGAAPFAAAVATATPILAKVKVIIAAVKPALKALSAAFKAFKAVKGQMQPKQQPVSGLGEVEFHGADELGADEFGDLLNSTGEMGSFLKKAGNILNKISNVVKPQPQPQPQTPMLTTGTPNPAARMAPPATTTNTAVVTFKMPTKAQPIPTAVSQSYTPQPTFTSQQPAARTGFDKIIDNVSKGAAVVSTGAEFVKATQNILKPPTPQNDGFNDASEQRTAKEMEQAGGDTPAPNAQNPLPESKKNNTMLYVGIGAAGLAALYFFNK